MNDRYLFKAKDYMTDEWIISSLIVMDWDSGYVFIAEQYEHASIMPVRELLCNHTHLVKKETICQCTGLCDINKNLIWENDIVRKTDTNALGWHREIICTVLWDKSGYWRLMTAFGYGYFIGDFESEQLEVIGSVADNPEPLEVKE